MLHVKDAIYATIKVTENKKCYNEIFNLGGDKDVCINSKNDNEKTQKK